MNVDIIRFVDRFAGVPLCWTLTAVRYLALPFRIKKDVIQPRRVLIVKLAEMGSTVLAYPSLMELKARVPKLELFFLVFENNRDIIDALQLTPGSNVITIDVSSAWSFIKSSISAISRLMLLKIDTTIDMDFFSRFSAAASFLTCRGNRVGFFKFNNEGLSRGRLLTHPVAYTPHVHTSVAFMSLVKALLDDDAGGVHYRNSIDPETFILPSYTPTKEDTASISAKMEAAGIDCNLNGSKLAIVNPNSSQLFPLRKWPMTNFTDLCKRLLKEESSVRIILTGSANEEKEALEILKAINSDRCISLVGMTSFSELMALFSMCHLLVTNDSGPAHFASLHQLPVIDIFGPETPDLYKPLGKLCKCMYSGFACSPCVSVYNNKKSACRKNLCLEAITVEDVLRESLASLS